jgi:pimeloyl-ACP methyl ester carboxylesterase
MSYEVMAADVNEFMASRGFASASFLGHSMGGKVAMEFALTFPGLVSRLVVADIAPKAYDPRHDYILDALTGLDLSRFSDRLQIEAALAPAIPELAVRRFLLKSLKRSGQHFEWQIGLGEIADSYPQISEELTGGRQFRGPTLFLRGAASDYVLDSDLPRIRELFPETDIKTLAGAGHWLHAEAPEAFVSAVRKFLLTPTARV